MNEQMIMDANRLNDDARRINKKFSKKDFAAKDYADVSSNLSDLKTRIKEFSGGFSATSGKKIDKQGLEVVKSLNDACFSIEKQLSEHFEPSDHY